MEFRSGYPARPVHHSTMLSFVIIVIGVVIIITFISVNY